MSTTQGEANWNHPSRFAIGIQGKRSRIHKLFQSVAEVEVISKLVESGYSTLDTADSYGFRNEIIGLYLAHAKRENVRIISKVFFPFPNQVQGGKLSKVNISNSINYSLKILRTSHIDVLLAHRFDAETNLIETISAFDSEIEKGRIRGWGISEWPLNAIQDAIDVCERNNLAKPILNQVQGSFLWRVSNQSILPFCKSEGISAMAWSPLAQGIMAGSYRKVGEYPSKSRMNVNKTPFLSHFENQELFDKIHNFSVTNDLSTLQLISISYYWLINIVGFDSVVISAKSNQISESLPDIDRLAQELSLITESYAVSGDKWVGKDSPHD
jgi:aryl-alcohol dehydrogenase-like predicted oxidoreductase